MMIKNYKSDNEVLDLKTIKIDLPIIYEILKKHVANIKLENM